MSLPIIRLFRTAQDTGERLARLEVSSAMKPGETANDQVFVHTGKTFQQFLGFGCALTEAAGMTFSEMPAKLKREAVKACFDPSEGLGYQIARLHMNSCDFSRGNWACDETPGDVDLKDFSLKYDRQYIIPLVKEAQKTSINALRFFASPWSPPQWMKTTGQMVQGGKLRPEYRQTWANYYVRFIREYQKEGIPIWGITVQNEPAATQTWESCVYTPEEERDFVRDYLGPTFQRQGLSDIRIMVWDYNRDYMLERVTACYEDPVAAKYIWGAAFHWYGENCFETPHLIHDAYPEKHLFFSEGCVMGTPDPESWDPGEYYARAIINDLNHWAEAWTDWNMLLNEQGGPNHVQFYCSAPLLYDRKNKSLIYQISYHYLSHFTRFILPGAKRLACASSQDALETTAFINTDGSIAVVVLNRSNRKIPFTLFCQENRGRLESLPHSILTIQINNDLKGNMS